MGLDKKGVDGLRKEMKDLSNELAQVQVLVQEISKRKFAFEVSLQTEKPYIFPYQCASVNLTLSSVESEAKKLTYTIRSLTAKKGQLYFENGEEVKEGMKIAFGNQ